LKEETTNKTKDLSQYQGEADSKHKEIINLKELLEDKSK
jgi:hypothetical protein